MFTAEIGIGVVVMIVFAAFWLAFMLWEDWGQAGKTARARASAKANGWEQDEMQNTITRNGAIIAYRLMTVGLSQAEQTGTYNGADTLAMRQLKMQEQQLKEDIENGKVDRQTALKQLEYIQAQIENMQADTTSKNLSNKYSQWQLNQL